ncbi:hypothetical protein F5X71_12615 [Nocardia brasiliensis]|uniref:Excreted virulence factor EspC, type VII ESX diderm n=1 Tax=Nocardia brasiliensis TaxID=37326 RepID=A0A6G9Y2S2_NOCBR|nr:hypothetical protein [Nocardia brasiliensis]QIS07376.1 hypothetical protein F5X71_12615 [Nocardia brasiliensis]
MGGFEVEIGQLRSAADAAGSAAAQAREVAPGTGLAAIATALPGGEAAVRAPALATTFDERARGWADEIGGWNAAVLAAVKLYTENEAEAERAFRR